MAPPPLPTRHYGPTITSRQVTEDTPPDLLEGTMDLQVTLPSGKSIIMNVHRSTPMMDLLVQVTTAHRINPGGHIIQVVSDNIFLSYKPSTPIGQLDTSAIKIVPKNKLKDAAKNRKSNLQQQAIERNIRLKVNLPRNQLAVYRVPPRTLISDILSMVCKEKNLDEEAFEIRHPVNVDERLRGSCALSDYQLQEVCVVSRDFRPPPLSVTDLITMASISHPDDKKRRGFLGGIFSRKAKSSTGDSSVSSGSAGERSVSPARSDVSVDGGPAPRAISPAATSSTLPNNVTRIKTNVSGGNSSARLSRPVSMISLSKARKGPAPVPPFQKSLSNVNGKVPSNKETKVSLSRHSSDSSGYHEPATKSSHTSPSSSIVGSLEATSKSAQSKSNLINVSSHSMSSIASSKGKRRAPPPPTMANKVPPLAIPEEDMDNSQNASDLSAGVSINSSVSLKEVAKSTKSSVDPSQVSNKRETNIISENGKESSSDNSPINSKENSLERPKDSKSDLQSAEKVNKSDYSKISSLNNSEVSSSKSLSDSHTSSETITESSFLEINKELCPEKIDDSCSDIPDSGGAELSNGVSLEPSEDTSIETIQKDTLITNHASPHSCSIPTKDTSATIDTSTVNVILISPNTSVESPNVDSDDDSSVDIDVNSRQLPCSTSENEVQTQKLILSSETNHDDYVDLLNDLQRPKRQKKNRSKIPEVFVERSADGPIYKSVDETGNCLASESEPLINDVPETNCSAALCDSSKSNTSETEIRLHENEFNDACDTPLPLFSCSIIDSQNSINKMDSELVSGIDCEEIDSFDVNGIIEVAQLSFDSSVSNILSENVPDNVKSSAVNIISEFSDQKLDISEAFNIDVQTQIQTKDKKDENVNIDSTCAEIYLEFPKQEESSTDPSAQTLERRKHNFTSKVELSSENDERLGLVKKPVQRSVSITRITSDFSPSSEEHKIKEEYIKRDVISELKWNIEDTSNNSPKILTLKPKLNSTLTSDYNVVLTYNNSSSHPVDKHMERSDSNSSYESVSSVSNAQIESAIQVKCDRSSTETSYESAPPPLPESHVPLSSDSESKNSRSSSVSRQSSLSECDNKEFKKPHRPSGPPQPVFSISTYVSRAEEVSYDKKLVRSESLMSIDDIPNKKSACVGEDSNLNKTKVDFLFRKLVRSDSKRNDLYRSEEALNRNFTLNRILPESSQQPGQIAIYEKSKSSTSSHTVPFKSFTTELNNSRCHSQDTFQSRRSAFECQPSPSSRQVEPIKFELGSAKDTITFSNRASMNPTSFHLRKAKSTFDIRGTGPADNKYVEGVAHPPGGEPGLAQEYMKLQDDFMKWQQQLLQNQHVLHSRVAPIASNPPTLNNFGMTKEMGPPPSQGPIQPKKPVEISIPIRFEDTGEIVGSSNENHISSRNSQEYQMPTQQYQASHTTPAYSQFSNPSWNNSPSVHIGAWEQRPAEREKGPSPSNQQSNFINSGSRQFNLPHFSTENSGPTLGMQTVFQPTPAQQYDNHFRYQEYPDQPTVFQGAPEPPEKFQEIPQSRYQNNFQPKFQAAPDPQMRFQEAQQPRIRKEITPPRFQELPQLRYQEAPQTRYQQAPKNVTESVPQYSPQPFNQTQNRPQMSYINGPANNSNNQTSDRNDDNINARFTSVVTLSNDKTGDSAPKKDKVRSIVQLNNIDSEPLQSSSLFRGGPVVKGFQNQPEPQNFNNEREKRSPPICSVTPMSSRLVQKAVQQPDAANSGGFRISPPRFERKSPSPPKREQSPTPFSNVALRHVEPRISPPRVSPLRISPPRESSPAISAPHNIPPPPAPPMIIPPPPPAPSSGIPLPPGLREGSEERRTSAGKRIMSANNVPQLDAREELMMAIRQFGGSSGKLRRSPHPF